MDVSPRIFGSLSKVLMVRNLSEQVKNPRSHLGHPPETNLFV